MIRELNVTDYDKGYLELLMQLKQTMIKYDFETFKEILAEVNENKHHKIFVIEKCNKIIATATILIETKFIYKGQRLAHIEDVVVDINHRRRGYADELIQYCIKYAQQQACYKIGLCSRPFAKNLYEKHNFKDIGEYYALYSKCSTEFRP